MILPQTFHVICIMHPARPFSLVEQGLGCLGEYFSIACMYGLVSVDIRGTLPIIVYMVYM